MSSPQKMPPITTETMLDEVQRNLPAGGLLKSTIWQVKVARHLGVEPQTLLSMTFETFAGHVRRLGLDSPKNQQF